MGCLYKKKCTYRKDISWPHFGDESRAQEKQQVKGQQSWIFVPSKLGAPAQTWQQYSIHGCMVDL